MPETKTVFIGGSRSVSRLPTEVETRLDNIIHHGHHVVVGDAHGVDKAVQQHFHAASYDKVTVFCSGDRTRHNVGGWPTRQITVPGQCQGFSFYAAKDRAMACEADLGLMIWDGKSPGTVLNVLRLVRADKIAVLFHVPDQNTTIIKTGSDWAGFLRGCSETLRRALRQRATPDKWRGAAEG
ncbi:MAG: hypothetical protein WAS21_00930 [Geminicoccaceae bacterium]